MDPATLLVCPETLGPLEPREDGLWSPRAGRLYPVKDSLIFMAYPERDATMIETTMHEEHLWQGTTQHLDRDMEFLRKSAPSAVELINLVTRLLAPTGTVRALELGSGSGWVSWLLARAGYDTWLCDFEANSLALGLVYEHELLHDRIVTDARYCPFPDDAFDVVLMKEFVHHVKDVDSLFAEAQRVLRKGGLLAIMEPTRSVLSTIYEIRHPDAHEGHHITWPARYRRAIRRAGLELVHETAVFSDRRPRTGFIRWARDRAVRETTGMRSMTSFAQGQLRILGGASLVIVARKERTLAAQRRPGMRVIDPQTLVADDSDREAFRDFLPILESAAQGLTRLPLPAAR